MMKPKAKNVSDFVKKCAVYQLFLRDFTPQGTLAAAEKLLPGVAETGVNVIYLLPVSESDADSNKKFWSERQLKSGCENPRSPYRISDYFKIDPEYGTDADLKSFVQTAHKFGMKVILDIVYYHAGPTFAKRHPSFVMCGKDGLPVNGEWAFPRLNFDNHDLREYLLSNMEYFVKDFNIDGYRCDVGSQVPLDFWVEGRRRIEAIKPEIIMISESETERPDDQLEAFDACYSFKTSYGLPEVLRGDISAEELLNRLENVRSASPDGARFLRSYDNHDITNDLYDNRHEKQFGAMAVDAMLVCCYTLDGIPFIYNGCEDHDTARHSIFANHGQFTIDRSTDATDRKTLLCKLANIRRKHCALFDGTCRAVQNNHPQKIISFIREKANEKILVVVNLSDSDICVKLNNVRIFDAPPIFIRAACMIDNGFKFEGYGFILANIK